MRCHSTNKNFLNFTKFLNKQPNSTIVSSYLSHQFAFLSNSHGYISFLEFYNFISLPYELSLRLFKTVTNKQNNNELLIYRNDFISSLSILYSDSSVEQKIEIAFDFLSQSQDPENKIYREDIEILLTQFHLIKNDKGTMVDFSQIINNFFLEDNFLTLHQFQQRSFYHNSTLLYLVLFYLVYYKPYQLESIDFYTNIIFNNEEKVNVDTDIVDFFFVQSFPNLELYEYLFHCYQISNFDINDELEELVEFEDNFNQMKAQMEIGGVIRGKQRHSVLLMPHKKRNSVSPNLTIKRLSHLEKSSSSSSDGCIFYIIKKTENEDLIIHKQKMVICGGDLYIFKIDERSDISSFKQIIPLKQLFFIKNYDYSENITDMNNKKSYYAAHIISTISNKIKDSLIFFDNESSLDLINTTIKKITKYKSLNDEYEIGDIIGKGSFGTVMKATHKLTSKVVAIKKLDKNYSKLDVISTIRSEVDIIKYLRSLDCAHVVSTVDIVDDLDSIYIIQEFVEGGTLKNYILMRNVSSIEHEMEHIYKIISQLILVISFLHRFGIIHRDLKCDNIMLDSEGNVKVIDFGLSGIKTHHDIVKEGYGTLLYLPPEIVKGEMYSNKVDIWTLGVVCYYLLYSHHIFNSCSVDEIMAKILYLKITVDDRVNRKNIKAKKINEIILACLTRDVDTRPDINMISKLFAINN